MPANISIPANATQLAIILHSKAREAMQKLDYRSPLADDWETETEEIKQFWQLVASLTIRSYMGFVVTP